MSLTYEVTAPIKAILAFAERFGTAHTALAIHTSVPLGLTPEMLHLIRVNFLPRTPWIAESDILLSSMCQHLGEEMYEYLPETRRFLFSQLQKERRFRGRVISVARFVAAYTYRLIPKTRDQELRAFLEAQHLAALAYLEPKSAARAFALAVSQAAASGHTAGILRMVEIAEALTVPLYSERKILLYTQAVSNLVQNSEAATNSLHKLFKEEDYIIYGVALPNINKIEQLVVKQPKQNKVQSKTTQVISPPARITSYIPQQRDVHVSIRPDLSHIRVLLVNDSPELQQMLQRLLAPEGCNIVTARSRAEALAQFQHKLFHIAIVDVRLEENNPHNRDGLQLVRDIHRLDPGVGIIIISVHADLQDVLELILSLPGKTGKLGQPRGIVSRYLTKTPDDLKKLPDLVYDVFQDVVQINWNLQINDAKSVMNAVTGNLQCATLTQPPTEQLDVELAELLRKLFSEATRIDLHPIASQRYGYSKAHVIQVDKYADDVRGATQIVKIAEYPLIEREIHIYHDYLGRLNNVNRYPVALEPYRRTRTLGGMIYTFLNMSGRVVDLAEAYQRVASQEQINHLLTNLYTDTLSMQRLYTKHLYQNVDMAAIYTQLLHLDPTVLFERQEELLTMANAVRKGEHAKKFYLRDGTGFLNPTEFAFTEPLLNDYYETVMHGDLHGRNVLVDKRWDTWVIDFADMGKGPILHDYLTMEAWLLISSIEGVPLSKLFAWSKSLFAARDEVYPELPDTLKFEGPVRKAHQSIMTVRRLAIEGWLGDRTSAWRAYLIGLLFSLLRLMKSRYMTPQKRFHALISAALVAQLLSNSPYRTGLFA